ncbi:hypothetical protein IWX49DRAFT_553165 [Phyllosticta citricarpa]
MQPVQTLSFLKCMMSLFSLLPSSVPTNAVLLVVQHPRKKIAHLGNKPFKGPEADKIFQNCIELCKDYTTDGYYHPGFQIVAWLKNDGCFCGVESIEFVVGERGPECRASDISC